MSNAVSPPRTTLWRNLALWRGLSIAGLACSLVFATLLWLQQRPIGSVHKPAALAAILKQDSGQTAFTTSIDPQRQRIIVIPSAVAAVAGQVLELWLMTPGQPPFSLGLLATDRAISLPIPAALKIHARNKSVLAISIEPRGGSPETHPTGPLVAQGIILRV